MAPLLLLTHTVHYILAHTPSTRAFMWDQLHATPGSSGSPSSCPLQSCPAPPVWLTCATCSPSIHRSLSHPSPSSHHLLSSSLCCCLVSSWCPSCHPHIRQQAAQQQQQHHQDSSREPLLPAALTALLPLLRPPLPPCCSCVALSWCSVLSCGLCSQWC